MKTSIYPILFLSILIYPDLIFSQINYDYYETKFPFIKEAYTVTVYENFPTVRGYAEELFFSSEYEFNDSGRIISQIYYSGPDYIKKQGKKQKRQLVKDTIIYDSIGGVDKVITRVPQKKIKYSDKLNLRIKNNKKIKKAIWGEKIREYGNIYRPEKFLHGQYYQSATFDWKIDTMLFMTERDTLGRCTKTYGLHGNERSLVDSFAYSADTSFHYKSIYGHDKLVLFSVRYFESKLNKRVTLKSAWSFDPLSYMMHYYHEYGTAYAESEDGSYQIQYQYYDTGHLAKEIIVLNGVKKMQYLYEYKKVKTEK